MRNWNKVCFSIRHLMHECGKIENRNKYPYNCPSEKKNHNVLDTILCMWSFQLHQSKDITRNFSKLRKIHSGQGHTNLSFPDNFSTEFKLVKPFVFLSFIFESTDRSKVFHMTHSWQLCCCSMCQICCDVMIRNEITTKLNSITFHMWLKMACELGPKSLRQPNLRKVDQLWKEKYV